MQSSRRARRYVARAHEARLIVTRLDCAAPDLVRTREALHALAEQVLAPARVRATGSEIALEATPGGFATPPVARRRSPAYRPPSSSSSCPATPATSIPGPAAFLRAFYAFADAQLRRLRADAEDPSFIHPWPERFDLAFDLCRAARAAPAS